MEYDEQEVMIPPTEASPDGRVMNLTNPRWALAIAGFEDTNEAIAEAYEHDNVFDMEVDLGTGECWYLHCCSFESLDLRTKSDIAISFAHARLL
jgi:hypothetical protein